MDRADPSGLCSGFLVPCKCRLEIVRLINGEMHQEAALCGRVHYVSWPCVIHMAQTHDVTCSDVLQSLMSSRLMTA